jgi:hypothetical protein
MTDTPPPSLTLWTFEDASGAHHAAVPVAETELAGKRYTLALSDKPGLIVLEDRGGRMAVVTDRSVVAHLGDALRSVMADAVEPVVVFDATGPDGKRARFSGTRVVAHAGKSFLCALDGAGRPLVFHAPAGPRADPRLCTDAALARTVLAVAQQPLASGVREVELTLPDGTRRNLAVAQEVTVGGKPYALAVDRGDPDAVFVLRVDPEGALTPVTDPAEVERVRAALERG